MSRRKHELTCLLCLLAECQHLAEKQKKTKRVKLRANRHHFLQACTYLLPPLVSSHRVLWPNLCTGSVLWFPFEILFQTQGLEGVS